MGFPSSKDKYDGDPNWNDDKERILSLDTQRDLLTPAELAELNNLEEKVGYEQSPPPPHLR